MRMLLITVGIIVLMATAMTLAAQDAPREADNVWMKRKLEFSKNILAGLTTEDFAAVRQSATAMRRMSDLESFARRKDTKAYRAQLAIFEFANDELLRHAQEKDIDGATLAFTQLTLSCVNCHKHLRTPAR